MKNLEPDVLAAFGPAPVRTGRRLSRRAKAIAVALAVVALVAMAFHFAGDALLTRFVRPKLEQACAAHLPGSRLRLGALRYDFWRNRIGCESVELTLQDGGTVSAGAIAVKGMRWGRWLAGNRNPEELARNAQIEITDLSTRGAAGEYRVRGGHLRLSVPDSEFTAQALTLQPSVSDEAFFAADAFRRIRYRLSVASCAVRGIAFAELLNGQAYRAKSVELNGAVFDSLVDREKPRRKPAASPRMPQDALAAIEKPFRIERLTITDGLIKTAGRRFAGAEPGVLTFAAVQLTAKDIANAAAGGRAIDVLVAGKLMDAGLMTVHLRIPVTSPTLAFHYAGTLAPMDLTKLDPYLEGTGRFQIKSGNASGASFEIDVVDGHARGVLRGVYRDFHVSVLDRETGSEKGVANRVATVLANQLKVRHENLPGSPAGATEGNVDHVRAPEDSFLQFAWLALRSGIVDLMTK